MFCISLAAAQEYGFDLAGNLNRDSNKQISSIHYNHLSLVDTITYSDGRKMIYTYTGAGQKLRERTILANGTIKQKRDYLDHVLYRNDTLQELQHEDGRSVPLVPGSIADWEYQYHLKDHLGNVRSTLTTKEEVNNNLATFETEQGVEEQSKFSGYSSTRRVNSVLFDHTRNGTTHYAQRLNGSTNEKYGLSKSLSVMSGDTVKLEAYAKYVDPSSSHWSTALTSLMSQIGSGAAGTVVDGPGYATSSNTPFAFAGLNGTSESKGAGPRAYLNWLVFDRGFVFKTGGYVKMSDIARENGSNVKHEKLEKDLIIEQAGYVCVYLSNEETTPLEVYFDDFSVIQVNGPVIRESDYDPFGMTFNEYSRENTIPNNFLYNGKELQKDFDLNWYDYGARMYDATLGRWNAIDMLAEKAEYISWSPYNYVGNNPILFVDPDGRLRFDSNGEIIFNHQGKAYKMRHASGPPEALGIGGYVYADDGTKILASENLSGYRGWDTDCHGSTFAKGRLWINDSEVEKILQGDSYVSVSTPKVGDVVIYRDENGKVVHSMTVNRIMPNGRILVKGQGGLEEEDYVTDINSAWAGQVTHKFYRKSEVIQKDFNTLIRDSEIKATEMTRKIEAGIKAIEVMEQEALINYVISIYKVF